MIKTPLRGRKDPLKFASLPTCGFVAQLVERPTSIWEARVQAPSKPEFFQASFSAISLIAVYLGGSIRYYIIFCLFRERRVNQEKEERMVILVPK